MLYVGGYMKNLIVVAHPDDEVLGAGAFIIRAIEGGDSVRIVIMNADGIVSRPDMAEDILKSHKILGVTDCARYSYPNLSLNKNIPSMVWDIEKEIKNFQPDVVITHFYGDIHPDHKAVFYATEQAVRLTQRHKSDFQITGFYCMDVPSSTNWGHESFMPDTYVGYDWIAMKKKFDALKVYKNVLRGNTHPRSERALLAHATDLGANVGLEYAEGFKTVWRIQK